MKRTIHVIVRRGDGGYVAECADLNVAGQAATLDHLVRDLREAIALLLDGVEPREYGLAVNPTILVTIELGPAV